MKSLEIIFFCRRLATNWYRLRVRSLLNIQDTICSRHWWYCLNLTSLELVKAEAVVLQLCISNRIKKSLLYFLLSSHWMLSLMACLFLSLPLSQMVQCGDGNLICVLTTSNVMARQVSIIGARCGDPCCYKRSAHSVPSSQSPMIAIVAISLCKSPIMTVILSSLKGWVVPFALFS